MLKLSSTSTRAMLSAAALVLVAACADSPSGPIDLTRAGNAVDAIGDVTTPATLLATPALWEDAVWTCKVGANANITVQVGHLVPHLVLDPIAPWSLTDGTCTQVSLNTGSVGSVDSVTVTELASAAYALDSINVKVTRFGLITSNVTVTGTDHVLAYTTVPPAPETGKGAIVTFYNHPILPPPPPPPSGGEGCTPGYWKQSQHFDSWKGYSPNQLFSSVFENAFPGMTLLQVLGQGGGGLNALGRHTVAALLNTQNSGVGYDLNTAGVINGFNSVFPGGNYEGQKNIFAGFNEQGCPLN